MKNKVVSLELSKKLKQAGITKDMQCEFWWYEHPESDSWFVERELYVDKQSNSRYPAPLSVELGEVLPRLTWSGATRNFKNKNGRYTCYLDDRSCYKLADTEPNARAKMLLYLQEKGLL